MPAENVESASSAPGKKRFTLRFDAPAFRSEVLMPCGKHSKPKNVPSKPLELGYSARKSGQRYRRVLEDGEIRGSCICDYHDYPVLRMEREGNSEVTDTSKPSPFERLPGELRNRIYRLVLVANEPIELCPEPFKYNGCGQVGNTRDRENTYYKLSEHYLRKQESLIRDAAGLLRTNHKFSDEAAFIFFSENKFFFSNNSGWIGLDYFLFKIGLKKAGMLRSVSVCHPALTVKPESFSSELSFSKGCIYFKIGDPGSFLGGVTLQGPGFEYGKRWFEEPGVSNDPSLIFQKAGTLRQLRFIIPAFLPQDEVPALESPVDASKFENLSIVFAGHHTKQLVGWVNGTPVYNTASKSKAAAEAYVTKTGKKTTYEDHWVDDMGYYTQSYSFVVQKAGGEDDEEEIDEDN